MSAASTVIVFCMPATVRLAQWPVMTTLLDTPLTLTWLLLQVTDLFSLMPETMMVPPDGGAGDDDGPADGVRVLVLEGPGLRGVLLGGELLIGEVLSVGDRVVTKLRETRFAA